MADAAAPSSAAADPTGGTESGDIDLDHILELAWTHGHNVVFAILILIGGWIVSRIVGGAIKKGLDKREALDQQIKVLSVKGVRFLIMAFTIVAVLGRFGIQTASIIAVLGGLGLAVGLALQGSLSNVASGVMIMVLRPFTLGQVIKVGADVYIVDDIGLFATKAHLPDGPKATIPNNKLWGSEIINLSTMHDDLRRIDETFGIAYDDDIDKAFEIIKGVLAADERYLDEPEPLIAVTSLGDSSVNILCRTWIKPADWWQGKLDLIKAVKQAFDAQGVTIPFPQRDVHLFQENAAGG